MPMLMQSPPGPEVVIDGRRYLYFGGTAYYALQGHAQVIRAACEATERHGIASATTRAWFGATPPLLEVEQLAAGFFGTEAAFYYASGYAGMQILLAGVADRFDVLLVDELSHYSVWDAARASGKTVVAFKHADLDDFESHVSEHVKPGVRPLVLSDGVFPVLGEIAPVCEYRDMLMEFPGAGLAIDDAHGAGVLGKAGRGTYESECLGWLAANVADAERDEADGPALFWCATMSKAFGGYGGLIAGSRAFIEHLQGRSHWYEGASSPPVPVAAATAAGIRLLAEHPELRTRLWENARSLKQGLAGLGLETNESPVPIVCLQVGKAEKMKRIQQGLADQGIMIAYAGAYSGLGAEGALRLAVCSEHTPEMIARLVDAIGKLITN